MTTYSISPFLSKFKDYLKSFGYLITPDIWEYYKEHGCYPYESEEDYLYTKFLKGGFDIDKIKDDLKSGDLTSKDLKEFIHHGIFGTDKFGLLKCIWSLKGFYDLKPTSKTYDDLIEHGIFTKEDLLKIEKDLSEYLCFLQGWIGEEEDEEIWESLSDWTDSHGYECLD